MKRTRSVGKTIEPTEPTHRVIHADEKESQPSVESDLSPERMMEGASATTAVLHEILARHEGPHQLRDWGINE